MPEHTERVFESGFAQDVGRTERVVADAAQRMTASLNGFSRAQSNAARASKNFSRTVSKAFEAAVFDGKSLSDTLRGLALDLSRSTLKSALSPLGPTASGLLTRLVGAASGAVFAHGRVQPFARGGIVNGPSVFPLRNGTGLIGEAGPEAVLPLARGSDGRLGIASQDSAARPIAVTVNISTPNAESFRRSQTQTAAIISRALSQGMRNL